MKKTLAFIGTMVLAAVVLTVAAPYGSISFFDGTTRTTITGVTLLTTNAFTGYLTNSGGALTLLLSQVESNFWTSTNKVSADSVTLVAGCIGYPGQTNRLIVSGAGSNEVNGVYTWSADEDSYTNPAASHGLIKAGSYWLLTNLSGETNYRKATSGQGLGGGSWQVVVPGIAPTPTSVFGDSIDDVDFYVSGSYDGTNWFPMTTVSVIPYSTNAWAVGYKDLTLTNVGYLTVRAATNNSYCEITNTYLRAFYK